MSGAVLRLCGDCAVTVEFENEISIETNRKVIALKYRIEGEHVPGIRELVPSYRSLLIHYDPLKIHTMSWSALWRNGPAMRGKLPCPSRS